MKVDFPSPFAPTSPICSPFNRRKLTSLKMALSPKPCVNFSTFKILINVLLKFSLGHCIIVCDNFKKAQTNTEQEMNSHSAFFYYLNCALYKAAYAPFCASNSSCVPSSVSPSSVTTIIRSAFLIVARR